jgi:hypothetical protein
VSGKDPLDAAFAALRDATASRADDPGRAAASRRAIVAAASVRRRRALVARLVLPVAAMLAASTAWAASTGRLPLLLGAASRLFGAPPAAAPAPASAPPPPRPAADATQSPPPTASVVAGPDASSAASAAAAPRVATPPVAPAEEVLYRAAHDAQFSAKDPGRAIAGWDAYLAAYPAGRFAPEARYNRGLALVRLGRHDDARAALRPFADGTHGGYRQAEAKELLDALGP